MQELYDAIKAHCDLEDESMIDAANHGADGGFNGFIYYTETVAFYDKNEEIILDYLEGLADNMGYDNVYEFVASLPAIKNVGDIDQLKNLYSWIILEEVGRWVEENKPILAEG